MEHLTIILIAAIAAYILSTIALWHTFRWLNPDDYYLIQVIFTLLPGVNTLVLIIIWIVNLNDIVAPENLTKFSNKFFGKK